MRQLAYKEITLFCEELTWLLHAGVTVGDGLHLLAEEEPEGAWKECLYAMSRKADESIPLSQIMEEEKCFPTYVHGLVAVGEETGNLEEALHALSRYYEDRDKLNRQIRSALLYPSILLVLMLLVMVVLLTQVFPVFRSVFASLGGELRGVAGGLYRLGMWLNEAMPVLCVLFATVIGLIVIFSVSNKFRESVLRLLRRYVGDKGIMRRMNEAGIAQAMAMGLGSGLSMEDTLKLAEEILKDVPAGQKRCQDCREKIEQGEPLIQALKESQILPLSACRLLSLGIQSGSGDSVMQEIADRLSQEADAALESKVAKVEPTLVLVTSILVGAILLSVMLPLMNIMETIG